MKNSISILLALFLFFFTIQSSAQNNEWVTFLNEDLFQVSINKKDCILPSKGIDKEYIFIQFLNTSDERISINYKIEKWFGGVCSNCEGNENSEAVSYTIELEKGESISGSCEDYGNRKLAIFSKMNNVEARKLTDFKIIPIKINDTNIK